MSLVLQAFLLEKYGPRLNTEQLAEVLGWSKQTLYNHFAAGTCPVKTYTENGKRWAAFQDVAEYFEMARQAAAVRMLASAERPRSALRRGRGST